MLSVPKLLGDGPCKLICHAEVQPDCAGEQRKSKHSHDGREGYRGLIAGVWLDAGRISFGHADPKWLIPGWREPMQGGRVSLLPSSLTTVSDDRLLVP